jgi:crossover junction endodeoxyribonuclease RusA
VTKELTLPWPPRELSPNSRTHWRKAAPIKAKYRDACYMLTKLARASIDWDGDVHMWIDFYAPDRRHRDDDNMIAAFKAGRDGIAEALGVNDRRFRIHPYVKAETGGMVKVRFTPGPEAQP